MLLVVDRAVDDVEHLPGVARWLLTEAAGRVDVVAPLLTRRLDWLTGDTEHDARRAQARLQTVVGALSENGVEAHGELGDDDPEGTVAAACARDRYDAVVILAGEAADAEWRERDLRTRVERSVAVPVVEVTVGDDGAVLSR